MKHAAARIERKPNFGWKLKLILWAQKHKSFERRLSRATLPPNLPKLRVIFNKEAKLATRLFNRFVSIKSVQNVQINGQLARIYRDNEHTKQPVMIYFHGGGMALYDLEAADANCRRFCKDNQCTVVNVDYRLAPEHRYPAAHNDAWAAFEWVHTNIDLLGGDAAQVVVMGDSAGGSLAASIAYRVSQQMQYAPLKAQILFYPWLTMDTAQFASAHLYGDKNYILTLCDVRWFASQYLSDPAQASEPALDILNRGAYGQLAPTLLIAAQCDVLHDEGVAFCTKIEQSGGLVQHRAYPNTVHGFMAFPAALPKGYNPFDDVSEFIAHLS